jgi:hypothetical protein
MRGDVGKALADVPTPEDAQLLLSLLVWPEECPDPRVVDEWLRRQGAGWPPQRRVGSSNEMTRSGRAHLGTPPKPVVG